MLDAFSTLADGVTVLRGSGAEPGTEGSAGREAKRRTPTAGAPGPGHDIADNCSLCDSAPCVLRPHHPFRLGRGWRGWPGVGTLCPTRKGSPSRCCCCWWWSPCSARPEHSASPRPAPPTRTVPRLATPNHGEARGLASGQGGRAPPSPAGLGQGLGSGPGRGYAARRPGRARG